jgi:hypothetical protein
MPIYALFNRFLKNHQRNVENKIICANRFNMLNHINKKSNNKTLIF